MTPPKAPKRTWIPVVEMNTSKDPNKYWQVQRDGGATVVPSAAGVLTAVGAEHLRCTCPGYVFKTRKAITAGTFGEDTLCKHLKVVRGNPSILTETYEPQGPLASVGDGPATTGLRPVATAVDAFKVAVTQAFMDTLGPALGHAAALETTRTGSFRAFVDALRPLASAPAPKPVSVGVAGRVRRMTIEE